MKKALYPPLFGQKLAYAMERRGLAQADLSRATGDLPANISRVLQGTLGIRPDKLLRIARTLGIPVEWLIDPESPIEDMDVVPIAVTRSEERLVIETFRVLHRDQGLTAELAAKAMKVIAEGIEAAQEKSPPGLQITSADTPDEPTDNDPIPPPIFEVTQPDNLPPKARGKNPKRPRS